MTTIICPHCKGDGFTHSSGDGWDEDDDCTLCGTTGRTTPDAVAAWNAETARMDAEIDELVRQEPQP